MRRWIIVLLIALSLGAGTVSASAILQADQCEVPADAIIEGNLFLLCQQLIVNGRVTGDIFGAALTVDINGQVDGSLYLLSGRMNLRGSVGQDVHFVGPVAFLRPEARLTGAQSDVYSFSLTTHIESPVPGSVTGAGYELYIGAPVSGDVNFAGSSLTIAAPVGGSVTASVGSSTDTSQQLRSVTQWFEPGLALGTPGLNTTTSGIIGGSLTYSSPGAGQIDGSVGGPIIYKRTAPASEIDPEANFADSVARYIQAVIRDYVATLLVGLVVVVFAPRAITAPVQAIYRKALPSFSVGLITFVLSFPAFLLAAMIGLGLVLLIALLGFSDFTITAAFVITLLIVASAALFYFTAVLVSRVIVSAAIARPVLRRYARPLDPRMEGLLSIALGGLIASAVSALPVIGIAATAIMTFLGLGAMMIALQGARRPREASVPPSSVTPPSPSLLPRGPGTNNLPDGFTWWE